MEGGAIVLTDESVDLASASPATDQMPAIYSLAEVLRELRDTDRKKRASCDRPRRATRRELFIIFFP